MKEAEELKCWAATQEPTPGSPGAIARVNTRLMAAQARAAEARAGIWNTLAALTIVIALATIAITPALLVWAYTALL